MGTTLTVRIAFDYYKVGRSEQDKIKDTLRSIADDFRSATPPIADFKVSSTSREYGEIKLININHMHYEFTAADMLKLIKYVERKADKYNISKQIDAYILSDIETNVKCSNGPDSDYRYAPDLPILIPHGYQSFIERKKIRIDRSKK